MNGTIRYWISSTEEYPLYYSEGGRIKGLGHDLIEALAADSGAECVAVSGRDGNEINAADAIDMLEEGSLDLVLGLPAGLDINAASVPICDNALTALILADSPQAGDLVENCYWGINSALLPLTENTVLKGHVLDFNSDAELFAALDRGDVYGILVKRSVPDLDAWVSKKGRYREFEGFKLPFTDSAYYTAGDHELGEHIKACAAKVRSSYDLVPDYRNETHTELLATDNLASYYNLAADAYSRLNLFTVLAAGAGACALILGVTAAVLSSKLSQHRKLEKAKLATLYANEPEKELFELNLVSKKLYAYKGFELLGANKGSLPNPVRLEKLSQIMGYDFTEHFSGVSLHGNTIYKNRFIIHAGGRKLFIVENGRRIGTRLIVTMSLLKQEQD